MRTLDRYLTVIFLKNLAFGQLAMTVLFLFQAIFLELFDTEIPLYQKLYYHWLSVPKVSVEMFPPAVLLATVLTLSGLNRSNELVGCFSI